MGCLARAWEATETFQPKPAQVEILKKRNHHADLSGAPSADRSDDAL